MSGELSEPFDVIISNPPFEHAYAFLYVALMMVSRQRSWLFDKGVELPSGAPTADAAVMPARQPRLLFILPSDFFEGGIARRRLYRILGLRVVREFKLARWSYYRQRQPRGNRKPNATDKISCDSLFELVPGRSKKVPITVVMAWRLLYGHEL